MALNLNLVDTLADEFGDSEGEEELEEEPMPGLLKVVSEMIMIEHVACAF